VRLYRPVTDPVEAVQWSGTNEAEVRELLGNNDIPFPRLGWWVVRRSGGVAVFSPADFDTNYRPI
jgi:hypothetical protein